MLGYTNYLKLSQKVPGVALVQLLFSPLLILLTHFEAAIDDEDEGGVFEAVFLHDLDALGNVPDLALEDHLRLQLELVLEAREVKLHHPLPLYQAVQ